MLHVKSHYAVIKTVCYWWREKQATEDDEEPETAPNKRTPVLLTKARTPLNRMSTMVRGHFASTDKLHIIYKN